LSGEVRAGLFYLNHHILLGHFAGTAGNDPKPVRDNGGFDLNLGINLSNRVSLDSLLFSLGTIVNFDRHRESSDQWNTPGGITLRGMVIWKGLGMELNYYDGQRMVLLYGDPFYRLDQYGRLDIFWAPFRSGPVRGKLNFIMHFAAGQIDYSQQILLSIDLDG
jgi:hypothetical protein